LNEARQVDPITLAVVSGYLEATVREMTAIIQRTARSPILALGNDFSNALYTVANGVPEMVIQGRDQPVHLGGMIQSVKSVASELAHSLKPGDVVMRNEPFSGGSHLIDIDLVAPIFVDSSVAAWACSRAHMGDIGGPVAGGYNPDAEDLYGEGLIIPAVRFADAGGVHPDILDLVLANLRIPSLVEGDLGAQLSAVRVATRRLSDLFARHGRPLVEDAMAELLDRAERIARSEVAAITDGSARGRSRLEGDGRRHPDVEVTCLVEKQGERVRVSIEPLDAVSSYRNSYPGVTQGAIYYALVTVMPPGVPINEGLYRVLEIDLGAEGTMLNARPPAACAMSTGDVWAAVWEAMCDALSQLVPERACAGWSQLAVNTFSGTDPRWDEPFSTGPLHVTHQGGAGAAYGQDGGGLFGLICTGGAASIGDIELLEFRLPFHFHCHELQVDSGCPGRWRGSPGAVLDLEIDSDEAVVAHIGTGERFPPPSRLGGGSADDCTHRVHRKWILRADGSTEALPLHTIASVRRADRVVAEIPGGGGVGPPAERDRTAVLADVRAGLVSSASARTEYGLTDRDFATPVIS
jgi:N-methylhydantoinase B